MAPLLSTLRKNREKNNNKQERILKNRLNDRFFKALFGVKGHEKYLISLLNSLFESYNKGRSVVINKLTFLNREVDALKDDGKTCRMDILAQIDDGSIIDVEVQLLNVWIFLPKSMTAALLMLKSNF